MSMNVNVDGLVFEGLDKTVSVPSWDYIMSQLQASLSPLFTDLRAINADLVRIDTKLAEWAEDNT